MRCSTFSRMQQAVARVAPTRMAKVLSLNPSCPQLLTVIIFAEFPSSRRVAFSNGGEEPQRPSTSSHPQSALKGRSDRPTSARSPPRAPVSMITPWAHEMHGAEAGVSALPGSGLFNQAYDGLAAFGLFKPVRYSVAEEVQKIYLQPVRPMELPARLRRDLRTLGGDARSHMN